LKKKSKPDSLRKSFGRWGEKVAEKSLNKKGLNTLTRNFSCKTGEIDLIMVDTDKTIVFVEVKTRTDEDFSTPESAINSAKRSKIKKTARFFLASNNLQDRPCRFDVITILQTKKRSKKVDHYQNAFTL